MTTIPKSQQRWEPFECRVSSLAGWRRLVGRSFHEAEILGRGELAMGAHPYWYTVKYKPDIEAALQELRQREFHAGRYNPVIPFPNFPLGPNPPAPGARHKTMADAFDDADADGTRSILDLEHVSEEPELGYVSALPDDALRELYGTVHPTHKMVEDDDDLWEQLDRGQGVYIILYKDDQPDEIFFAGYSFD
jgi:hypothetical protein